MTYMCKSQMGRIFAYYERKLKKFSDVMPAGQFYDAVDHKDDHCAAIAITLDGKIFPIFMKEKTGIRQLQLKYVTSNITHVICTSRNEIRSHIDCRTQPIGAAVTEYNKDCPDQLLIVGFHEFRE